MTFCQQFHNCIHVVYSEVSENFADLLQYPPTIKLSATLIAMKWVRAFWKKIEQLKHYEGIDTH